VPKGIKNWIDVAPDWDETYTSSLTYDLISINDFQFFKIPIPSVLDVVDQVGHFDRVELWEGRHVAGKPLHSKQNI